MHMQLQKIYRKRQYLKSEKQNAISRNRLSLYIHGYYAFRKQMSIWCSRRRVGDIIISGYGKGVKSTVKQAYASQGGSSRTAPFAQRTVVNGSLSQCPLKSLVTMAHDRTIALSSARASWSSRLRVPASDLKNRCSRR